MITKLSKIIKRDRRLPKIVSICTDDFFTLWKSRQLGCLHRHGWGIWFDKYEPREQQPKRERWWTRSARTSARRSGKKTVCGGVVTSPSCCTFICWGSYLHAWSLWLIRSRYYQNDTLKILVNEIYPNVLLITLQISGAFWPVGMFKAHCLTEIHG